MTNAGEPVWLELESTNLDRSLAFYTRLFGWKVRESTLLKGRDAVAGFSSGERDGWLIWLSAREGAGSGILTDPGGAPVGAQDGARDDGPRFGARGTDGTLAWAELHTTDFALAVPFYRDVFGWRPVSLGDSDEFRMVVNADPAEATAGIYDSVRDDLDDESAWMPYFAVKDTDVAAARVRELGGALLDEVVDTPFGRMVHATDPLGTLFTIIRPPSPSTAERTH